MATLVAWVALLVATLALGFAWKLNAELATAARRLDRYNKALFDANDEIRRLREEVEEETAQTRVALRQRFQHLCYFGAAKPVVTVSPAGRDGQKAAHNQLVQVRAGGLWCDVSRAGQLGGG